MHHCEFQSDKSYHTHIVGLFLCFIWQQLNMMKSPHVNMESSSIFQGILFPLAWSSDKKGYHSTSQEVMDVGSSLRTRGWSIIFEVLDVSAGFLCCWVTVWFPPASGDVNRFSISFQLVERRCTKETYSLLLHWGKRQISFVVLSTQVVNAQQASI